MKRKLDSEDLVNKKNSNAKKMKHDTKLDDVEEITRILLDVNLIAKDLVILCVGYLTQQWNPYTNETITVKEKVFQDELGFVNVRRLETLEDGCLLLIREFLSLKDIFVCEVWSQEPMEKKSTFKIPSAPIVYFQTPHSLWVCSDKKMFNYDLQGNCVSYFLPKILQWNRNRRIASGFNPIPKTTRIDLEAIIVQSDLVCISITEDPYASDPRSCIAIYNYLTLNVLHAAKYHDICHFDFISEKLVVAEPKVAYFMNLSKPPTSYPTFFFGSLETADEWVDCKILNSNQCLLIARSLMQLWDLENNQLIWTTETDPSRNGIISMLSHTLIANINSRWINVNDLENGENLQSILLEEEIECYTIDRSDKYTKILYITTKGSFGIIYSK